MRKTLYKTLFAGFFLCLLACLGACLEAGVTASAAAKTPEYYWHNSYVWWFEEETGTLHLYDISDQPESLQQKARALEAKHWSWLGLGEKIRYVTEESTSPVVYGLSFKAEDVPNLTSVDGVYCGVKWTYDRTTDIVTVDYRGPLSGDFAKRFLDRLNQYLKTPYYYLPNHLYPSYRIVLGDKITTLPPEVQNWRCDTLYLGAKTVPRDELGGVAAAGYEVSPENPYCAVYNNSLYSKDYHTLYAIPMSNPGVAFHPEMKTKGQYVLQGKIQLDTGSTVTWKLDPASRTMTVSSTEEVISTRIYDIWPGLACYRDAVDRLVITGSIRTVDPSAAYGMSGLEPTILQLGPNVETIDLTHCSLELTTFEVDPANPYLAVYDGALYTKDFSRLIAVPREKTTIQLHPAVKILSSNSFDYSKVRTVVVPWGATTLEEGVFTVSYATVVLPDTVTSIGYQYPRFNYNDGLYFLCSDKLRQSAGKELHTVSQGNLFWKFGVKTADEAINRVYHSGSRDPGWVGQNQYLLADGSWAKGWKKVDGYWYFLDQEGLLTQGWLKDKGTTYYLQPGGVMATAWRRIPDEDWQTYKWYCFEPWGGLITNRWIYGLDKKWYYVGADGAMLTDTVTSDGYRVNADGQWVR